MRTQLLFPIAALCSIFYLPALADGDVADHLSRNLSAVDKRLGTVETKEFLYGLAVQQRIGHDLRAAGEIVLYRNWAEIHASDSLPNNTYKAISRENDLVHELNLLRDRYARKADVLENYNKYETPSEFDYASVAVQSLAELPKNGKAAAVGIGAKILTPIVRDTIALRFGSETKDLMQRQTFGVLNGNQIDGTSKYLFKISNNPDSAAGRVLDRTLNVALKATRKQSAAQTAQLLDDGGAPLVQRAMWKDIKANLSRTGELSIKVEEVGKLLDGAIEQGKVKIQTAVADLKATYEADRKADDTRRRDNQAAALERAAPTAVANTLSTYAGILNPEVGRYAAGTVGAFGKFIDGVEKFKLGTSLNISKLANIANLVSSLADGFGMLLSLALGGPSETQIILDELEKMQKQTAELRSMMLDRFDSVDRQLGNILKVLSEHAVATHEQLVNLQTSVSQVQATLAGIDRKADEILVKVNELRQQRGRNIADFETRFCSQWQLAKSYSMSDTIFEGCLKDLAWCASGDGNPGLATPAPVPSDEQDLVDAILRADLGAANFSEHLALIERYQRFLGKPVIDGRPDDNLPKGNPAAFAVCGSAYGLTLEERPDLAAKQTQFTVRTIKQQGERLRTWIKDVGEGTTPAVGAAPTAHPIYDRLFRKYGTELFAVLDQAWAEYERIMNSDSVVTVTVDQKPQKLLFNRFNPWNASLEREPATPPTKPLLPDKIEICDSFAVNPSSPKAAGAQVVLELPSELPFHKYLTEYFPAWMRNADRLGVAEIGVCYDDVHFELAHREDAVIENVPELEKGHTFFGSKLHGPLSFTLVFTLAEKGKPVKRVGKIDVTVTRNVAFGLEGISWKILGDKKRFYNVNAWLNEPHGTNESRFDRELETAWQQSIKKRRDFGKAFSVIRHRTLINGSLQDAAPRIYLNADDEKNPIPFKPIDQNPDAVEQRRVARQETRQRAFEQSGRTPLPTTIDLPRDIDGVSAIQRDLIAHEQSQKLTLARHLIEQFRTDSFANSKKLSAARRALEATVAVGMPRSLAKLDKLRAVFFGNRALPDSKRLGEMYADWLEEKTKAGADGDLHIDANVSLTVEPSRAGFKWDSRNEDKLFGLGAWKKMPDCSSEQNPTRFYVNSFVPTIKDTVKYERISFLTALYLNAQVAVQEANVCLNQLVNRSNVHEPQALLDRAMLEIDGFLPGVRN